MSQSSACVSHPLAGVKLISGIQYGEPPVGPLRFAPPRLARWNSLEADQSTDAVIAPQTPSRLSTVMGDFTNAQSEDCLNLSVWTREGSDQRGLRPVLFWLHGGAFMSGGGALDWYDGSTLCSEGDIVVVSPNYRLGALGFLFQPHLSPGNLGLLDAELALRWTRENIREFGGDPDRITVMGQSAGAWMAALMAARMDVDSPSIHQLILQSGPLGIPPTKPENAQKMAEYFLNGLAANKDQSAGNVLAREASVHDVLSAQGAAIRTAGLSFTEPGRPPVPFGPVSDGTQLPSHVGYSRFLANAAARVPVLAGWTLDEMSAFNPVERASPESAANANAAAAVFEAPLAKWAMHARAAGKAAFIYSFDWAPKDSAFGACHCIDLPFTFGTLRAFSTAPMLGAVPSATLEQLSSQVRSAWLAFVKWGDPNKAEYADRLPHWPGFDAAAATVMHIDHQSHLARLTVEPTI